MTTSRICLLIDAHPVVREGIRGLIDQEFDVEELEHGSSVAELRTSVGNFAVAVVEMRPALDGLPSGAATIRELLTAQPGLGIVALGGPLERHAVREAFDAGAMAYVSRLSALTAMSSAIAAAADGETFVDPAAGRAAITTLTPRQRQVLQLFADGLSTEQAAQRLRISEETVRTHAKASLARMNARDRTHAVAKALRGSLIE
jgi:DNA-binding NarL/FixJ family response regulator